MADNSGGQAILALVVGGLLVFVVLVFTFGWGGNGEAKTVSLEGPKISTMR